MIIGYDPARIAKDYIPNWSIKTMPRTSYVKCSYCGVKLEWIKRSDHKCADTSKTLGDTLGDALIQEDHNYGSVLDEDNDQNMITIPATLLTDVMHQQQKLTDVTTEHNANVLIAKLYECVASHYENGDRNGAEAILNAIGYAQQSS